MLWTYVECSIEDSAGSIEPTTFNSNHLYVCKKKKKSEHITCYIHSKLVDFKSLKSSLPRKALKQGFFSNMYLALSVMLYLSKKMHWVLCFLIAASSESQ